MSVDSCLEYILVAVDVTGKLRMLFAVGFVLHGACQDYRTELAELLADGLSEDDPDYGIWIWIGELVPEDIDAVSFEFGGYSFGKGTWHSLSSIEISHYLIYGDPWYDLQCDCVGQERVKFACDRSGIFYSLSKPVPSCPKCHGLGYCMLEREKVKNGETKL